MFSNSVSYNISEYRTNANDNYRLNLVPNLLSNNCEFTQIRSILKTVGDGLTFIKQQPNATNNFTAIFGTNDLQYPRNGFKNCSTCTGFNRYFIRVSAVYKCFSFVVFCVLVFFCRCVCGE